MLGKLLAAPVRLLNVPARAVEKLLDDDDDHPDDRVLSAPMESVAKAIEEAVDGEDGKQ